ncbi:MAG: nucleoside hydrolase [Leptolyngbyaceae cyanobacterium bins.349]|nr:nucleoside hydrolase [Leptolyngbyaceae cyanobacterium bins.349]
MLHIILDTDPGGDDVFALLWLLSLVKQHVAKLIAVTTTAGNVTAEQTFANASRILKLTDSTNTEVGRGVLKAPGSEDAAHIHGTDGMGGLAATLPLPDHDYATARGSDDILIDRLSAAPGEITIVAIGPLTNLAAAEAKRPGILKLAKEIVIMGGAFYSRGNVTPQAEFNIWFHPEAAQVVLNSRSDSVIIPLDVTKHLIFTREMVLRVNRQGRTAAIPQLLTQLCEFMISTALQYRETNGIPGFLVHDAATLGYLFYPETLRLQRANVKVETQGEWTRGQTLIDDRPTAKSNANSWVAREVDTVKFFTHLIQDLYLIC